MGKKKDELKEEMTLEERFEENKKALDKLKEALAEERKYEDLKKTGREMMLIVNALTDCGFVREEAITILTSVIQQNGGRFR